ncbi:MAG: YtxH domain-containing protein [Gemmatimonadota bacterium]|nr:YtxH domain-containing protein [Gemmatimonadota bacterium]
MARSTEYARRARGAAGAPGRRNREAASPEALAALAAQRPSGASYDEPRDWGSIGLFAAGLALGIALGAGTALLTAPMSGRETRQYLGDRVEERWSGLRDEVRFMGRRGRRKLRRALSRGRWAAEDVVDRGTR